MGLICEDLSAYGVVLISPTSPRYFALLTDIERRLHNRPKGSPSKRDEDLSAISEHDTKASAILLNRASVAIVALAYIWSFRGANGRMRTRSYLPGTNASVLLPFGLDDRVKTFHYYWNTIFAGSKRLLNSSGSQMGDNTDVRPPAADELWTGGFFGSGSRPEVEEPVKLTLDGVFFEDGGFAGPNRLGAWESIVFAAEAYLACSALAREAGAKGTPPAEFFLQVQNLTGQKDDRMPPPPPPPPLLESNTQASDPEPIRKRETQTVGWAISKWLRPQLGDQAAMQRIASWADLPVPHFHKL